MPKQGIPGSELIRMILREGTPKLFWLQGLVVVAVARLRSSNAHEQLHADRKRHHVTIAWG